MTTSTRCFCFCFCFPLQGGYVYLHVGWKGLFRTPIGRGHVRASRSIPAVHDALTGGTLSLSLG
eukprot:1452012-Pyramimonas_sp.AAC.1